MIKLLTITILLHTLSGCAFYYQRIDNNVYGEPFVSTKTNFHAMSSDNYILGSFSFIFIFDIPFSIVTDIILLPYDLYLAPAFKADRQYWDKQLSSTNAFPPDYEDLSKNYSEYGSRKILDKLGREYLKHHPEYAIPFIKIAANNIEVERSSEILSKVSDDWQVPTDTMVDICTLSISNIIKYRSIIIGYIRNKSTPSICLHNFVQVLPSSELSNNRHQVSLFKEISKRLNNTGKPEDSHFALLAKEKAGVLHESMQVEGTITSVNFNTKWLTIKTVDTECISFKFYKTKALQIDDFVSGEFKESGGSKAFNDTNKQLFNIYVPYSGDELESTAKKLCL